MSGYIFCKYIGNIFNQVEINFIVNLSCLKFTFSKIQAALAVVKA